MFVFLHTFLLDKIFILDEKIGCSIQVVLCIVQVYWKMDPPGSAS